VIPTQPRVPSHSRLPVEIDQIIYIFLILHQPKEWGMKIQIYIISNLSKLLALAVRKVWLFGSKITAVVIQVTGP
jgi:hypothetical protein